MENNFSQCVHNSMTHIIDPRFTERHRQAIIGTVLGGSSIVTPKAGKNSYLSMRGRDGKWLEYKANECLNVFASNKPFTIEKTNRWHSLCYPVFSEIRDLFYEDSQRKLTLESLEKSKLSDFGISIWVGDAGKMHGDKLVINTHIWDRNGTLVMKEFLKLIDINAEVLLERGRFRLAFSGKDKVKLLAYAMSNFPPFMEGRFSI